MGTPPDDGSTGLVLVVLLLALLAAAVPFAVACSRDVIVSGDVHAVLLTVGAVAVLTPSDDTTALLVVDVVVGSAIPCCGLAILRGLDGGVFVPCCSFVDVMLYLLIDACFYGMTKPIYESITRKMTPISRLYCSPLYNSNYYEEKLATLHLITSPPPAMQFLLNLISYFTSQKYRIEVDNKYPILSSSRESPRVNFIIRSFTLIIFRDKICV